MRVAVLRPEHVDAEASAAARWVAGQGWELREVDLRTGSADALSAVDAIWCHAGSAIPSFSDDAADALGHAVRTGGHLLLSLLAAPLAVRLGAEGTPPSLVEIERPWDDASDPKWPDAFRDWPGYPHIRGFQGWGEHPLFAGLQGGTFSWASTQGEAVSRAVYVRPHWPDGRVIAVDRSYVHLDSEMAVAWEYELGAGRITCLGANVVLGASNHGLDAQRDTILRNALVAAPGAARTWWPTAVKRHAAVSPIPRPRGLGAEGAEPMVEGLTQEPPVDSPVTLGATHGLIVGSMAGGVGEVWLHPLCVIDGGIAVSAREALVASSAHASPVHLARTLADSSGTTVREVAFQNDAAPEFVYVVTPSGDVRVNVQFRVPLRLEWPFAADALVPLRTELRREGERATVLITGRDGAHVVACFLDGACSVEVSDDEAAPVIRAESLPGEPLRVVLRASSSGSRGLVPDATDVWTTLRRRIEGMEQLRKRTVQLHSSDPALNAAWDAARSRLANFMVAAPGGGRGLMAGYAGSRPGWNISRPGYAWFFGRDACWTIDALLSLGMFLEARDAISLLARTMDVTGKVFHEFTTSGVVHYDAADSTPLFLRAVGKYAAWTGDLATVQVWWPAVLRAFDFVRSCDRDGDGLPENTGVGHGWIEMGPLGGGAVTSYVAAIWIDALRLLIPVAERLSGQGRMQDLVSALQDAEIALESLRGPDGVLALHRDANGRLSPDRTAMAAVPLALGVGASSRCPEGVYDVSANELLADLASPRFSAAWGLRMLPVDDPRYDPRAYHAGAVWPLFTGWVAIADGVVGSPQRALARVRQLAAAAMTGGTGGFAEVLNGDTGLRAGVCPDQAWSAAMIISPIVHGFAGIVPDALRARATLRLRMPDPNDSLHLEGIRVGETRFDLTWTPTAGGCAIAATHRDGPPITLDMGGAAETCGVGAAVHLTVMPDISVFELGDH